MMLTPCCAMPPLQSGFASLAHSFASSDSLLNEKRDSLTRHEELAGRGRMLLVKRLQSQSCRAAGQRCLSQLNDAAC